MITAAQTRDVMLIPPQVIRDAADWAGSYGSSAPNSVDTTGYAFCTIRVAIGSIDAAMESLEVMAGPAAASGADDSTFALVAGAEASGSSGAGRLPQDDDDEKYVYFDIDCRKLGANRHLALEARAGNGAAGTYLFAEARLSRADEVPTTAADRNAAWVLTN